MTPYQPDHKGHQLTDADRHKGWHNPEKLTQQKVIVAIKNRKKCSPRCVIFELCPMMPLSMSRANVEGACLLNRGGNVLIRRFVNLMVKGEDGLLSEINNVLYSYAFDIETAPPSVKKEYAQMLMQLHNQLYAKKEKELEQRPNLTVVINEMGSDGKLREIVPLIETGHVMKRGENLKLNAAIEEAKTEDPESLMNSPIIKEIMDVQKPYTHKPVNIEGDNVQEPYHRPETDERTGTEREPEELEETSSASGGGTERSPD